LAVFSRPPLFYPFAIFLRFGRRYPCQGRLKRVVPIATVEAIVVNASDHRVSVFLVQTTDALAVACPYQDRAFSNILVCWVTLTAQPLAKTEDVEPLMAAWSLLKKIVRTLSPSKM
jgi:hypothetical protein